jgi:hypothetical protein
VPVSVSVSASLCLCLSVSCFARECARACMRVRVCMGARGMGAMFGTLHRM